MDPGIAWKWRVPVAGWTGLLWEAILQGWPLTAMWVCRLTGVFNMPQCLCKYCGYAGYGFWESRTWACTTQRCWNLSRQPPSQTASLLLRRNSTVTGRGPERTALGFLVTWPVFPFPFASFDSQSNWSNQLVTYYQTYSFRRLCETFSGHQQCPKNHYKVQETLQEGRIFLSSSITLRAYPVANSQCALEAPAAANEGQFS